MGEVYLGVDEVLHRDVALKMLPQQALGDDRARRRLFQEAQALSRLNHPHIATIYEFVSEQGLDCVVMERLSGSTLETEVARGALENKRVLRLGVQMAEGLAAAHKAGVLHRDLKPANLHVSDDDRLKILDFGLALQSAGDAATASLSGGGGNAGLHGSGNPPRQDAG